MKERRLLSTAGLALASRFSVIVGGMAAMAVGRPCAWSMRRRVSPAGVTSMVGESRRSV
jgi:hypothetical protein